MDALRIALPSRSRGFSRSGSWKTLALAAGAVLLPTASTAWGQYIWTATGNGNWSTASNWNASSVPPSGGGTTVSLTFNASGTTSYTATNDRGNPFVLNSLNFAN